jgi:hypothetical protein
MTNLKTIGVSLAGLAAIAVVASPASAQYYPQPAYPQQAYPQPGYPQQGYPQQQGGVIGQIVGAITGNNYAYGQYPQGNYGYNQPDSRFAVQQCAAAVERRTSGGGGYGYNNGYGNRGYANQGNIGARVVGITSIERRSRGQLRVKGVASSNAYAGGYQGQYGDPRYQNRDPRYQGYGNQPYGVQADLTFNCKVDLQGRITDLKLSRAYNGNYRR